MIPTLSLIDIRSSGQLGSFLQAAGPRCVSCILGCSGLLWAGLGYESVIQETYCHAAAQAPPARAGWRLITGVSMVPPSYCPILPHITQYCPKHTAAPYPAQPITCSSSGNVGKQIKLSCSSSSLQPGADCCRPSCSATAADTTAELQTLSYQ